jgi:hypothetical protein
MFALAFTELSLAALRRATPAKSGGAPHIEDVAIWVFGIGWTVS